MDVILRLQMTRSPELTYRIVRCQQMRRERGGADHDGWPWQCRSAGCYACRRARVRSAWVAAMAWADESRVEHSLIQIPMDHVDGTIRLAVRRLRREVRRLRDRQAVRDSRWQRVEIGGIANSNTMDVLALHASMPRAQVAHRFLVRWPGARVTPLESNWSADGFMSCEDAAALARARRGIEPLRLYVGPHSGRRTPASWAPPVIVG